MSNLRVGELEALPIAEGELDAALLSLVLHHSPDPRRAIVEARRVLKAGGRLLLVDLLPHEQVEYRERLGHVWLGFSESQVTEWMEGAGFSRVKVVALPTDPGSEGAGAIRGNGHEIGQQGSGIRKQGQA